jgi:sugar/nucleoside kinase (ribokinase family)
VEVVVVKLGAEGSFCICREGMVRIGVRPSKPVDTTGAGDMYSAGFIYGHMHGMHPEICGKMGAILAGRVIEMIGAKMDESNWEKLRREIHTLMD